MSAEVRSDDRRLRPLAARAGESTRLRRAKFEILVLLSEQKAIPLDQLLRFGCVGADRLSAVLDELESDHTLRRVRLIEGDQPWIWLTCRGVRLSGTGYKVTTPGLGRLGHLRAINEVRLELARAEPAGRWICERALRGGRQVGENIPDAVFEIGSERHAIEVELSSKMAFRVRQIVAEHRRRYDVVVYFCGPRTFDHVDKALATETDAGVFVRRLPGTARVPGSPGRAGRVDRRRGCRNPPRPLGQAELAILELIAEQGAVPVDQLARFRDMSEAQAVGVAERLHVEGHVHLEYPLAGEPAWLALSFRGSRALGGGLQASEVRLGALELARATNEVRLHLAERVPRAHWISHRRMRAGAPGKSSPRAVLEIGAERHAIEVLTRGIDAGLLVPRIERRSAEYDAVVCFSEPALSRSLRRLQARHRFAKLAIRDLPKGSSCASSTLDALLEEAGGEARQAGGVVPAPAGRKCSVEEAVGIAWVPGRSRPAERSDGRADRHLRAPLGRAELAALGLIAEQGIVPVDQLARFRDVSETQASGLTDRLHAGGYVSREWPWPGGPAWVALTYRGSRILGGGLPASEVKLGALELARATNEVRLYLAARAPHARWVSRRRMQAGSRPKSLPRAVLEIDGERHAIEVLTRGAGGSQVADRLRRRCAEYDAVVCFSHPGPLPQLQRLVDTSMTPNLIVRGLPEAPSTVDGPRAEGEERS